MVIYKYISIVILFFSFSSFGAAIDFHKKGVEQFEAKKYNEAEESFKKEIKTNPNNVSAFFNLGLTYSAQKKYSKSIWAFERVLKLKPNHGEAIENIERNYTDLDNGQVWASDLSHFERTIYGLTSHIWAFIAITLSLLTAIMLFFLGKSTSLTRKRGLLVSTIVTFSLFISATYLGYETHTFENSHTYGLVTEKSIPTFKDASIKESAPTSKKLMGGTKVRFTNRKYKGSKVEVESMDGKIYFINSGNIDRI